MTVSQPDASSGSRDLWLGTVRMDPAGPIIAGSLGTYTFTYRVGRFGIDNGGTIKIAVRLACDWGRPQLDDPAGEGYTTVRTTGAGRLRAFYDARGYVRPFNHTLVIEVSDEALGEGDEIIVVWGDTSRGGPGCRAQTFVDPAFEFRTLVDCFGTQQFRRLSSSPVVEVVAAPPERLVLVAPSTSSIGDEISGILRAEDQFGNAASESPILSELVVRSISTSASREAEEGPRQPTEPARGRLSRGPGGIVRWSGVRLSAAGTFCVAAIAPDGREMAASNPIHVTAEPPRWRLCWGDTQGQSGATVGTGDLDSFFRHARATAALDFVVHSGNDFQITGAHYQATRDAVTRYHEPGRFVTFLSYEWSGNTPAGGDYNIIYLNENNAPLHRSSQWQIPGGQDDKTNRYPVSALWDTFRGRTDVLAIPHVGGRYANADFYDPGLCPVLEIASVHGRFDWFAEEAIARGLRVGFIGATDDHSGRPGTSPPTAQPDFGHHGGLAAVYASTNTREALFEALRARRCYATTGARILLWTEMDGWPMGAVCEVAGAPCLVVRAAGTAPLDWVEILRGTSVVYHRILRPRATVGARRLRVAWSGARIKGRGRPTRWDGGLRVEGGYIRSADPWGFETPGQGITLRSARDIRWQSTTAGDPDGVVLDVDAGPDAVLFFETAPATFTVRLDRLDAGPYVISAGGIGQKVEIDWIHPNPGPLTASFGWEDTAAPPGTHAYWVRLMQSDTHAAWSSPIYATFHHDRTVPKGTPRSEEKHQLYSERL